MESIVGRAMRWWGKAEMALAMCITLLIVLVITTQIIARYIFNSPVPWMEEAAMIMFIYLTLLAAAIAAKEKRHIIVDLFPEGRLSNALGIIMSVLTIVILGLILAHISPIITVEMRRSTVSLPVNFPIAFYNSIPLTYCFTSIIVAILYDLIFERKHQKGALV